MGITEAAKFGAFGFVADRVLGTGLLGTLAGAAYGGLFRPDAGEMSDVYDKRKATIGQTLKDFFGYEMTDGLFGTAAKSGQTAEGLKASPERAAENAKAKEKQDGFPWGKALLAGGAAYLGINILDNLVTGPFSTPWFAPMGPWGGYGMPYAGVLPDPLTALLGVGAWNILF
ncbi:hypothetical protein L6R52_15450 [Myxococcota bacterium]|nr:hypothetical protein [Myxococcota bacterium]